MHFNGKIISYLKKCFNSKKIVLTDQRKCFESGFMTFYSVFFMETFSDNENLPQNWVFDYILSGKYYPISMASKFFITYQWWLYEERCYFLEKGLNQDRFYFRREIPVEIFWYCLCSAYLGHSWIAASRVVLDMIRVVRSSRPEVFCKKRCY